MQREILTALINIQRREGRAIKGEEIASVIDRNPGTVRNQMQSLKALHLVEGVPGPKGGYRTTAKAYEALNLSVDDEVVDVPIIKNGSTVEGATANEITFYTVMRPDMCSGIIQIIGNIREFNVDDEIEIGPTPVNKTYIKGVVTGRDDTSNRMILDIKEMVSLPKAQVKTVACPVTTMLPETSLKDASRMLVNAGLEVALVGSNGDMEGLIDLNSIVRAIAEENTAQPVKDLMTKDVPSIDANRPVYEAIKMLNHSGCSQVVVTESGMPLGFVTAKDLMRSLVHI